MAFGLYGCPYLNCVYIRFNVNDINAIFLPGVDICLFSIHFKNIQLYEVPVQEEGNMGTWG